MKNTESPKIERFYAHTFFNDLMIVFNISVKLDEELKSSHDREVEAGNSVVESLLLPVLDRIYSQCELINLPVSKKRIEEIQHRINMGGKLSSFNKSLDDLKVIILDEISQALLLIIPEIDAKYFLREKPFGESVFQRFPSAQYDILEASRSFSLERFTATVMHLQRAMESGLRAYAKLLEISIENQPNWNNIINRKNSKKNLSLAETEFCNTIQAFLDSVRVAWRNPSMHLDKFYDRETAKDILLSVRGFMKAIAKNLNEDGEFTL